MDFTQFNKNNFIDWAIENSDFQYVDLKKLAESNVASFICNGLYISKSGIAPHPIAIVETLQARVNLPSNLVETVEKILDSKDAIQAIKDKKLMLSIRQYTSKKYNKECLTVDFMNA